MAIEDTNCPVCGERLAITGLAFFMINIAVDKHRKASPTCDIRIDFYPEEDRVEIMRASDPPRAPGRLEEDVFPEYDQLKRAVEASGFFTTYQPIRTPGDRIVLASEQFENGLTGVSCWVAKRGSAWYIATWAPHIYQVPAEIPIESIAIEVLRTGRGTPWDLPVPIKSKFGLVEISDEDFDRA
jgi:hypothetical protein